MKIKVYLKSGKTVKGKIASDPKKIVEVFKSDEAGLRVGNYLIPSWDILRIKILEEETDNDLKS